MATWNPIDSQLYDRFKQYVIDALRLLSTKPIHSFVAVPVVKVAPGMAELTSLQVPVWQQVNHSSEAELRSLPSYDSLLQSLLANESAVREASTVYSRGDGRPLTAADLSEFFDSRVIDNLLLNYLGDLRSCEYEEERFSNVYRAQEQWVLTEYETTQTIAMLSAFVGPEAEITIAKGIKIRKAQEEDFSQLVRYAEQHWRQFSDRRWMLEIEIAHSKKGGSGSASVFIERLLSAMRLTKKGGVCCTNVLSRRKEDRAQCSYMQFPASHIGYLTELTSDREISNLQSLFVDVGRIQPSSVLAFALRRFNYAYERQRIEDRFIDLVVALESIFVPDGGSGEIGYKFRMRMSRLLGDRGHDLLKRSHTEIVKIAKAAYDLRSSVVHGDTKKVQSILGKLRDVGINDIRSLTDSVEEFTRASIRILLHDATLADPKHLDNLLLGTSVHST